jgi:transposase-like protein
LLPYWSKTGPLTDTGRVEMLAFAGFPPRHRRTIWLARLIERINMQSKQSVPMAFTVPARERKSRRVSAELWRRRIPGRPSAEIRIRHDDMCLYLMARRSFSVVAPQIPAM